MKRCGRCSQLLGESAFYVRRRRGRVELTGYCKVCAREHGRPWRRSYKTSDVGREKSRVAERARYQRQTPVLSVEEMGRRHLARKRAAQAVYLALKQGRLVRPASCSRCGGAKPEAHHHLGYEKAHYLDVEWICRRCHEAEHHHPYQDAHSARALAPDAVSVPPGDVSVG